MKVKTVERMIDNAISMTSFDESTITSLECLHEMLSADGPEEETAALHLAFKGNGGPELLIKIMDSPKPRDLRIPLLDLLTKISSAMAIHDSGMVGGVILLKAGDIAGDPTEKTVEWPKHQDGNVYIPFNISIAFNSRDKNEMDKAFGEFQEKTCVRFVARKQELDYINFQALGGSWSFLGKKGGAQSVSLQPGMVDRGTVLHELMHALGFHHEHCRSDRDDHVHIHEDNIKESALFIFNMVIRSSILFHELMFICLRRCTTFEDSFTWSVSLLCLH
ncbi:astacin-like [Lampetra fluviatilis]